MKRVTLKNHYASSVFRKMKMFWSLVKQRKKRQKTILHLHFPHRTASTVRKPITHAGAAEGGITGIFPSPWNKTTQILSSFRVLRQGRKYYAFKHHGSTVHCFNSRKIPAKNLLVGIYTCIPENPTCPLSHCLLKRTFTHKCVILLGEATMWNS